MDIGCIGCACYYTLCIPRPVAQLALFLIQFFSQLYRTSGTTIIVPCVAHFGDINTDEHMRLPELYAPGSGR